MARIDTSRNRVKGDSIVRFGVHQRIQHTLMFVSFFVLAVTGLPLKYSDWGSSRWWMGVWGGIDNVRSVHRFVAWVMVAVCLYHLLYTLFSVVVLRRRFSWAIFPRLKDAKDLLHDMRHTLGLVEEGPKYDRFSYRNKGAYWLTFIGAFVMVGTGLLLMYPVWTANHLAGWWNPLALAIHGDAALLAVGWTVLVHLYYAHLAPHVFPLDKSIFTGKVPAERYRHEFPLEYDRIMAEASEHSNVEAEADGHAGSGDGEA